MLELLSSLRSVFTDGQKWECRFSKDNVDLAAALLTLACLGEGKEISWVNEPRLRFLLGLHSLREASKYAPLLHRSHYIPLTCR